MSAKTGNDDVDAGTAAADRRDAHTSAGADRAPTPDEERAAERGAAGVDRAEVAENYEEMLETGADVKGEGEITP